MKQQQALDAALHVFKRCDADLCSGKISLNDARKRWRAAYSTLTAKDDVTRTCKHLLRTLKSLTMTRWVYQEMKAGKLSQGAVRRLLGFRTRARRAA